MRVLICGNRDWENETSVREVVNALPEGTVVIEGGARGADRLARIYAVMRGLEVKTYEADWALYGRGAGPIRNRRMVVEGKPDWVIAFKRPGPSKGTQSMIDIAESYGIPVEIHES